LKKLMTASSEGNGFCGIDFEPVFKALNDALSKANQTLALVCAGGYVLQLHGYRATADVDAFYQSNAALENIIRKVGDEFGINKADELWLNNSISNMNPEPPDMYCKPLYSFSNLVVKAVELWYLIGMKLKSGRSQDLEDVAAILKHDHIVQPLELLSDLASMKFDVDISVLLDVFGKAHGIEWLEQFYTENESKLREYF